MIDFVEDLNKEQQKAVRIHKGPILILAGAGSGKTRVITYRVAYLIHNGITRHHNILAITFTNKAADEMKTRIHALLGNEHAVWIRTFHSTCAKILRDSLFHRKRLSDIVGATERFTIYDEQDQISVMKECLADLGIDTRDFPPATVLSVINRFKQNLLTTDQVTEEPVAGIYKLYATKLQSYNALDFGDLIMRTVELLRNDKRTLEYYQNRFKYILVDEYQDTNKAQYVFTRLLADKHRNLCVVGDDDQSIYSWRGAEIRNILDFEKDFPETTVIKLEQNYRSTKTILHAASSVVKNNSYRKKKTLWCENEEGERIEYYAAIDSQNEAAYVARKIVEMKFQGVSLSNIAVFYRINYQSRVFEECFIRFQIPYEVVGALRFYERAEIKNVIAYLRVCNNSRDTVSLKRIINVPSRKIGFKTVEKITRFGEEHKITFFETMHRIDDVPQIHSKTKNRIKEFVTMMDGFIKEKEKLDLYTVTLRIVRDSGYLDSFDVDRTEKDYIRRKNVEELLISIKDYVKQRPDATLEDYLEDVSLRSDIDDWNSTVQRVSLMTLHNAKGLEFNAVFITGIEDGLIPHYKSQDEEKQYEEERRLLYVGITRARKKLLLTYAQQRDMFRGGVMFTTPSPFLKEIPDDVFATSLDSDYAL